ncbi:MAG: DUF4332 domain-containing protein [Anaerolineae bacterium]|jgi:predicted flap endonuclease-1-like 5' DNA nuclease
MTEEFRGRRSGLRWWGWALILVGLPVSILLLWWWWRSRAEARVQTTRIEIAAPSQKVSVPVEEAAEREPDDLKRIAGIGPKISALLQDAGIATFAQLAATNASELSRMLKEAGIPMVNPSTWPQQASLAAAGEWETLEALQAELKGGRR